MAKLNLVFVRRFCSRMVSLHRTTKIALMVTADLIALPFCFLAAMLLRGGDLKLAPAFIERDRPCIGDCRSLRLHHHVFGQ